MTVANDMFQARVVSIDNGGGGEARATIGWLEEAPVKAGDVLVVMTLQRFETVTQTAKSLGKV